MKFLYAKYFSINLKSLMQYKLSFLLVTAGQFLTAFSTFLGVYFMFSRFNAVEGFGYEEVLLCYAVVTMAFSLSEMFAGGFSIFPRLLGNGEFDRALVRPRGSIYQVVAHRMDLTRVGLLIQAVIVLCYAIPKSGVAWTWDKVLTFCLMAVCGCMVFSGLFLLQAAFAFFTVEGLEFMNLLTYGGKEFGRYPFSVYGKDALRFLTYVIPLALVQYYPLLYLLGRERSMLYMLTPLIGMLFLAPCYAVFRAGLRRFKSTGS
jgi:ABC-2 type transport system permease protein